MVARRTLWVVLLGSLPLLATAVMVLAAVRDARSTSPDSAALALLPASTGAATAVETEVATLVGEVRLIAAVPDTIAFLEQATRPTAQATGPLDSARPLDFVRAFLAAGRFRSFGIYDGEGRALLRVGTDAVPRIPTRDLPDANGAVVVSLPFVVGRGAEVSGVAGPGVAGPAPSGGDVPPAGTAAGTVLVEIVAPVTGADGRPLGVVAGTVDVSTLFPPIAAGEDVLSMAIDARSLEFLSHPSPELRFGATLGTGVTAATVFGSETTEEALRQSSAEGTTGFVRLPTGVSAFKRVDFGPGVVTENQWIHIAYVTAEVLPTAGLSGVMLTSLLLLALSAVLVLAAGAQVLREERRREAAQADLVASERRFRTSMQSAGDPILLIDWASSTISFANDAACTLFEATREDMLGARFSSLVAAVDFERMEEAQLALRTSGTASATLRVRTHSGKTVPTQVRVVRLGGGETQVIARDMTAWFESQAALEAAQQEVARILDAAPDGILLTDAAGVVQRANPAAERIFGGPPGFALGRRLEDLLEGVAHEDGRAVARRADGGRVTVDLKFAALDDGDARGQVVSLRDVTAAMALEAQLRQAQKLESVGQLAAGIAHEINTPTQYVSDNTGFVRDAFAELTPLLEAYRAPDAPPLPPGAEGVDLDFLLEEVPSALGQSVEGLDRIATIVRAMKEFSHPGSVDRTATNLNRAVESTITVARNEWKYAAELRTDLDPDLPPVPVVPGDFNQVVLNLIVNAAHAVAARHEPAGDMGTITVSTRRDGEWVEVRVTDDGTGIPPELQARIFEPFFTTKEVGRGTGQGLALAHTVIVDRHGGSLSVESEVGVGSTFIVRLPLEPPAARRPAGSEEPAEPEEPERGAPDAHADGAAA